jgi:ribosomal protein S18 acetylase RimI-like enzyme
VSYAVREATPADGPAFFEVWQALRLHNASVDRRIILAPVSKQEFLAGFDVVMARPTSATFVAEEGGAIVGFITGSIEANQPDRLPDRHATIGYLYTIPAYRRQGVARSLFEALVHWASAADGVSHFEMTVLEADEAAAAFWRGLGFTPFIRRLWAPLSTLEDRE